MQAGAYPIDSRQVIVSGQAISITNPADSHKIGIESLYQTLALAGNARQRGQLVFRVLWPHADRSERGVWTSLTADAFYKIDRDRGVVKVGSP